MTSKIGLLLILFLSLSPLRGQAADSDDYAIYAKHAPQTFAQMLEELGKADVVFVGENHDHKQGHALELAILKGLAERNPMQQALSLEMFERDVQGVLNEYLDGFITESAFLQAARPWPNYKEDYRPLVEYCREHKLPVVAANAPRRYVNIVSRKGPQALAELPKASKTYLPPLPYTLTLPEGYDRQLTAIFTGAHGDAPPAPAGATPAMPSVANMKAAQALWDAAMADSILRFLRANRGRKLLQINGAMHSDFGYGIVDRLRKASPRTKALLVTIRPVATYPNLPADLEDGIADYVILTRVAAKPEPAK